MAYTSPAEDDPAKTVPFSERQFPCVSLCPAFNQNPGGSFILSAAAGGVRVSTDREGEQANRNEVRDNLYLGNGIMLTG
jgi:hypothetical protein